MENKQSLNTEQAINYIKAKEKTAAQDIKKDIEKAKISITPQPDRVKYLSYALSFLTTVSPEVEKAFFKVTEFISASMSSKAIAKMLKTILKLRIHNYSVERIAYHLKTEPKKIMLLERLAIIAVGETIQRLRLEGIPILGNN